MEASVTGTRVSNEKLVDQRDKSKEGKRLCVGFILSEMESH